MAIKGLTDRGMAFPEIGIIRKGAPKETDRPGKDLHYFRVVFDAKEEETNKKFISVYGSEPSEINIIFPFDDLTRFWDAWMEAYTAGRMIARSDGETFSYLVDPESGEIIVKDGLNVKTNQPEPYREIIGRAENTVIKCKPTGRLRVIIPELQRLAYLTVKTTSLWDVINISDQLSAIQAISGGTLRGIPLVLRRRPKMISTPGQNGKRVRREKWLINIETDQEWVKAKLNEARRLALPDGGSYLLEAQNQPDEIVSEYDPGDEEEYINGDDFQDEIEPEETIPAGIFATVLDKAGIPYSEKTSEELNNTILGINKHLNKHPEMEQHERDEYELKRDAAKFYLTQLAA
jgi:hypothetical protein